MISKSGLDAKFYKDNKIAIDDINGDTLTIKTFNRNDVDTDVPIRWLELIGRQNKLLDVTEDPEEPITLTCDPSASAEILKCNNIEVK